MREVRRFGHRSAVIGCRYAAEAGALALALRREGVAREVVAGMDSVVLEELAPGVSLADWASREVAAAAPGGVGVELPTTYEGADLEDVARLWGMTRAEAAATHRGLEFTVAFCGFSPGFAYLVGLPASLQVPRLERPRDRVPAGSVGLSGDFTGVYPRPSPGGWRLIGHTEATLWDLDADVPALLSPGTRVRFTDA